MWKKCSGFIFKKKVFVYNFGHYKGLKLMNHNKPIRKSRGSQTEVRLNICEQQFDFMWRKRTTDVIFAQRMFLEKNREGQNE